MKKSKRFFAKRLYYKPNSVLVPHTRGDGNQGIDTGKVENELDRRVTTHKKDAENQGENQLVYGSKRFSDDIQLVDRDPVYTGFYPTSIPHKRDHQVSSDAGVWPSMSLFTRNRLVFSDPEQVAGRESYSGAFVSTKAFSGLGETASLNNAEAGLLFSSTRTTEKWVTDASLATKTSAIQVDDSSQVRLTLRGEGKNVKTGITLDKAPIHVIRLIALLCQEAMDETGYLSDLVRSSDDDDYESIYEACSHTGDYGDLFQDLDPLGSSVMLITGAIRPEDVNNQILEALGVTLLHTASSITTDGTDSVLDAIIKVTSGRWNTLWEALTTYHELRCTNGTNPWSVNPTMKMVLEQLVWMVLLYCITSPRSRYFQMIDDGENLNSGSFWSSPVKYRQLVDGYFTGSPATDEVTKNNIDPDFPMFRVMCRKDWKTVFEIVERKLIGDWETWLTPLDGFHEITAEAFKTTLIDSYMNANNLMNPTMDELISHFAQRFGFNEDAIRMSCESSYSTANWIYGIADILERMSPHTLPDESADFAKVRRTLTWTAMTNIAQNNCRYSYRHALLRMLYPYRFHNTTKDAGVVLKKSLGNPDNLSLAPLLNPEEFNGSRNCVSLGEVHNPFLGVYALNIPIFSGVFGIGDVVTDGNETTIHAFTFRCVSQHEYEPFVTWTGSRDRGTYYGFTDKKAVIDIDLQFGNLPRVGTDDVWVATMKITFPDSTNVNSDHPNVYMMSGYYFDHRQLSSDGVSVSWKGNGVFTPKMSFNKTSPNNQGDNPLEKKLFQIQQLNYLQDTQVELDEVSQSDAMILCKDLTDLRAWCQVEIFLIRKTNRFDKYTPGDVKDVEKVIRMEQTALPKYYLLTLD